VRVAVVSTEPTPYRVPQFDRLARRPELDLFVFYAAETIQRRHWTLELDHPHEILRGPTLPLERVLFHDYPVTPSLWRKLDRGGFDVVVVWGWSTFAAQLAVVWARRRRVPYVVFSESQLAEPRTAVVRAVKGLVVPRVLSGAAGYLVTGTRAREHLVRYGADPARIHVFANTVDVEALAQRVAAARERRPELRARFGLEQGDVAVLYAGRLIPLKAVDVLAEAVRTAGPPFRLVVVGDGPERGRIERAMPNAVFTGFLPAEALAEAYAAADVFALLSRKETWGVVVTEAAAAGLPLVVSERVGAGADLVVRGRNGAVVPADDPEATAAALRELADPEVRGRYGRESAALAEGWGYEPSEDAFVAAVNAARGRAGRGC
jgi:glycosyltransferase involved in cell wall biosynthesis